MNTEQLKQLEKDLWSAADNLRANTDLTTEYATPVLGLIFLKFADNNYACAESAINAEFAKLTGTRRETKKLKEALELLHKEVKALSESYYRHIHWLQERFPNAGNGLSASASPVIKPPNLKKGFRRGGQKVLLLILPICSWGSPLNPNFTIQMEAACHFIRELVLMGLGFLLMKHFALSMVEQQKKVIFFSVCGHLLGV